MCNASMHFHVCEHKIDTKCPIIIYVCFIFIRINYGTGNKRDIFHHISNANDCVEILRFGFGISPAKLSNSKLNRAFSSNWIELRWFMVTTRGSANYKNPSLDWMSESVWFPFNTDEAKSSLNDDASICLSDLWGDAMITPNKC